MTAKTNGLKLKADGEMQHPGQIKDQSESGEKQPLLNNPIYFESLMEKARRYRVRGLSVQDWKRKQQERPR